MNIFQRYDYEQLHEFEYRLKKELERLDKLREQGIWENEYYLLHILHAKEIKNINMSNIDRIINKTKYKFNAYK